MGIAGAAVAGTAIAGVAGSALSSSNAAGASKSAAAQQAAADQAASGQQYQALSGITNALTPYTNTGMLASAGLNNALTSGSDQTNSNYVTQANGFLGNAANSYGAAQSALGTSNDYTSDAANIYGTLKNGISESTLQNTPGYQFTLGQGLESTQSSAAARGLASSGAALKGAATYATGLADSTYQNQYNDLLNTASGYSGLANNELGVASGENSTGANYNNAAGTSLNQQASLLDTNNQNYNQLLQGTQLGEQAANAYGEYASQAAGNAGGYTSGAGAATASGTTGAASAVNNGISGVSSSLTQSLLLNKLLGGTSSSTSSTGGLF
jgi:hypothetical protein